MINLTPVWMINLLAHEKKTNFYRKYITKAFTIHAFVNEIIHVNK